MNFFIHFGPGKCFEYKTAGKLVAALGCTLVEKRGQNGRYMMVFINTTESDIEFNKSLLWGQFDKMRSGFSHC